MDIDSFIKSHGYAFSADQLDGQFHEFSDSLGNKGWYIGKELSSGKLVFTFGDWRKPGESYTCKPEGFSGEEQQEFEETQKRFSEEKSTRQELSRRNSSEIFERWRREYDGVPDLKPEIKSEYLARKHLPNEIAGVVVRPSDTGAAVIVPMSDVHGSIWNFQTIFDDGSKTFCNFGRVEGLFFGLGFDPKRNIVEDHFTDLTYICEGFATGVALHLATGCRVLVAFSLSNLEKVAAQFKDAVIACDNDSSTETKMREAGNRAPHNPGLEAGYRLLEAGRTVVYPPGDVSTDYADIWVAAGHDSVQKALVPLQPRSNPKKQSHLSLVSTPKTTSWANGITPMGISYTKSGKPILPEQKEVAARLWAHWDGKLIKSGDDIFLWTGKYWRQSTEADEQVFMQQIVTLHDDLGDWGRFVQVRKLFGLHIPFATRNLYLPNPSRITFENGTLCIDYAAGAWKLDFREHQREDYCVNLIPFEYRIDGDLKNELFEETLNNIIGPEASERRAIAQMFGSALAPMYPRLFLLVGKSGSGKSTLIQLATALVSGENVSHVQPADFKGFNMELMAGKLINVVTDLDVVKPIEDSIIKMIEDRVPVFINRKFKKAVHAPFPAVHIFGANSVPPTLDRGSMAHSRRWTFIPCNHFQKDVSEHDKHRVDRIREAGMQAVIHFAVQGLMDLLNSRGVFYASDAGKSKLKDWQILNDPIQSFLEAVRREDVEDIKIDPAGRCYTKVLWEEFVAWHDDAYNARPKVPKMKFFEQVEMHLGARKRYQGREVFGGVESKKSPVRGGNDGVGSNEMHQGAKESVKNGNDAGCKLMENSNELF